MLTGFRDQHDCSTLADCEIGEGLICAGLTRGDEGQCFPAWMRGNFTEQELDLVVPDADAQGLTRTLMVYGLATVDMDVELDVSIVHPSASELRVTLTNPAGNEVTVFDGAVAGGSLDIDGPVLGFSGDESINGPWTLRIVDSVAGQTGALSSWTLQLASRFD